MGRKVNPLYLTQVELAKRWGIHPNSLANDRVKGRGLAFYKLGGKIRYSYREVRNYEKKHKIKVREKKGSTLWGKKEQE